MCGSDHSDINGGNAKWYNPFGTSLAISYKVRYTLHLTLEKTSLIIVTESGSMVTWGWSWGVAIYRERT